MFSFAGLLCGSCKNNTGVSVLLNNCVSCSNGFICLIVALGELCTISTVSRNFIYVLYVGVCPVLSSNKGLALPSKYTLSFKPPLARVGNVAAIRCPPNPIWQV